MASAIQQLKQQQQHEYAQQNKFREDAKRLHREMNHWTNGLLSKSIHPSMGSMAESNNWAALRTFFEGFQTQTADCFDEGLGTLLEYVKIWDVPGTTSCQPLL